MAANDAVIASEYLPVLMPALEAIHGAPIGWFPVHPRNPSKLIAHKFVDDKWVRLSVCRFVPR